MNGRTQTRAAHPGPGSRPGSCQIDATHQEIDQLVYDLYELTDEEIAIVEQATGT